MLLGRWPSTRTATPSPNTKPQALRCVWGHWSLLTAAAAGLCRPVLACGLSTNTDFQGHGQHLHLLGTVDPWEDRKRSAVGGGRAAGDRVMNLWTSSPCFCPPPMPGPARSGLSAGVGAMLTVTQTQAGAALVGASACVPPSSKPAARLRAAATHTARS